MVCQITFIGKITVTFTDLEHCLLLKSNTVFSKYSSVPVAQWLEHCVSSAKVMGSIPREHTY